MLQSQTKPIFCRKLAGKCVFHAVFVLIQFKKALYTGANNNIATKLDYEVLRVKGTI